MKILRQINDTITYQHMLHILYHSDQIYIEAQKSIRDIDLDPLQKNIHWHKAKAERLPFKNNVFDFYSISYGIRNVSDINLTLQEAFRILKPGGRFMCLEFSKIDNEIINILYQQYSKAFPLIGKYIVGSSNPYDYLVKSIKEFYNQDELSDLIKKNGFSNVEYRNLSNGISAIHSGWKI